MKKPEPAKRAMPPLRIPKMPVVDLRQQKFHLAGAAMALEVRGVPVFHMDSLPDVEFNPTPMLARPQLRDSRLAGALLPAIARDVVDGRAREEPEDELPGGALDGEDDYLAAHAMIDWTEAPFATMGWVMRHELTGEVRAWWVWIGADGESVESVEAPTFGVEIHPGRGMTLRHPDADRQMVASAGGSLILPS